MLEMIYENDINNAKVAWNAFIESVKSDVKSLKTRQSEIAEMEKNAEVFSSLLADPSKVIENKNLFIELEPSLASEFNKLEFFKEKNNLENKMAEVALNKIISNSKVIEVSTLPITVKTESESVSNKLKSLEELLDNNLSPSFIMEVAKLHNMTDDEVKQVLFYYVYRTTPLVRVAMQREENKKVEKKENVKIEEIKKEEVKKEIEVIPEPEVDEEPIVIAEVPVLTIEDEPTIKDKFDEAKKEYDKLKSDNKKLLSRYTYILKTGKNVSSYVNASKEQLYELGFTDDDVAEVTAYRLFKAKEAVENYINIVNNDVSLNNNMLDDDASYAMQKMDDFKKILDELKEMDEKELEGASEKASLSDAVLFFSHDDKVDALIPNDPVFKRKISNIINKTDDAVFEDSFANATKLPYVEQEVKFLGKDIYMLLTSPSVSYVKVKYENEEARFIITMDQRTKISAKTSQILLRYGDEILEQIKLIEQNNPDEIEKQTSLRKKLANSEEGL